jgi:hypothetical protein
MKMKNDTVVYCNCMLNIRKRIALVWSLVNTSITTGQQGFDAELIFVQFRKVLELIAFSSLTANKQKYALAYANFTEHWKAKRMLDAVAKINPNFFPVPLADPEVLPNGRKNLTPLVDRFLTKDDFEFLYDKSSAVLHERNPFSQTDPVIDIRLSAAQWASRIQRLLFFHRVDLVDESKWVVSIPREGDVQLWPIIPADEEEASPLPLLSGAGE